MSNRHLRWLYEELPKWVREGWVTDDASRQIQSHYGKPAARSAVPLAIMLFGVLGALLIGSGLILLIAHNWPELTRPTRTVVAFLPLVVTQLIGGWVLLCRPDSRPWKECIAMLIQFSVGGCIALIAQTYHMPGSFDSFMLTWMLLSLPLVYIFRAVVPAVIYLAGTASWAVHAQVATRHAAGYWILLLLVLPFVIQMIREKRHGGRATLLCWALPITIFVTVGVCLEKILPGLWIPIYAGLFAAVYLAGQVWFYDGPTLWQRPLQLLGGGGTAVLSFMLTYHWPWEDVGWNYYRYGRQYHEWAAALDYVLFAVLVGGAVALLVRCFFQRKGFDALWGFCPIFALVGFALVAGGEWHMGAAVLFNLYLLVLGVVTLVRGIRAIDLGTVNAGMLVVSGLVVMRFFDSSMSISARSLVFILLGTGFLVTNVVIARRKGGNR